MSSPALALQALRIPGAPMLLSRQLVRGLRDGNAIIVERSWTVQFARHSGQLKVNGVQQHVKVDAPERLRALADIEEARREEGMFPLLLSENGLIQSADGERESASLDKAIEVAEAMIAENGLSGAEQAQASNHLRHLQRASQPLLETLPADLLFPSLQPIHDVRKVNMPDGSVGEFELRYEAIAVPQSGWLDHAKREVITRLGPSERRSSETWRLQEIAD